MVTGKQQADGSGEREAAVTAVGGHTFITHISGHPDGKVLRIRKGMHTQPLVTHTHATGVKTDVLKHGGFILQRQGEIFLHQSGTSLSTGNLVRLQPAQADMAGIVHDTLELFHSFQKPGRRVLVNHLLGQKGTATEAVKVTPLPAALTRGLRQIQVAFVVQVRALVEMALIAFRQEALFTVPEIRTVGLLREPVLLADNRKIRQHFDSLYPGRVDSLVFGRSHSKQFGKFHLKGHGQVGVLADNAAVLHRQQGELTFKRFSFQYISHFFLLLVSNRNNLLRWIR